MQKCSTRINEAQLGSKKINEKQICKTKRNWAQKSATKINSKNGVSTPGNFLKISILNFIAVDLMDFLQEHLGRKINIFSHSRARTRLMQVCIKFQSKYFKKGAIYEVMAVNFHKIRIFTLINHKISLSFAFLKCH